MFILNLLFAVFMGHGACDYSLENSSVKVGWTGYKTTDKTGVPGVIQIVSAAAPKGQAKWTDVVSNATFTMDAMSVDSANSSRDKNLRKAFFSLMKTPYIKGFVESADDKSAQVMISMNGNSKSIPFVIKKEGLEITATANIDVLDFMMKPSVDALNKKCYSLHKGKDGKSKTWSEVALTITATLKSNCKE